MTQPTSQIQGSDVCERLTQSAVAVKCYHFQVKNQAILSLPIPQHLRKNDRHPYEDPQDHYRNTPPKSSKQPQLAKTSNCQVLFPVYLTRQLVKDLQGQYRKPTQRRQRGLSGAALSMVLSEWTSSLTVKLPMLSLT